MVLEKIAVMLQPRVTTLDEVTDWVRFLFEDQVSPTVEGLVVKGLDLNSTLEVAEKLYFILDDSPEFTHEELEQPFRDLAQSLSLKLGQIFGVLRIAVTAQSISPPLIESMEILGKEKTLDRLKNAINLLKELT
jgi:glutamyl-tRNA synthetase